MAVDFVLIDHDTPYLLPPSVQDYVPQDHLAHFVVELVDQLNLRAMVGSYRGKGRRPYHPAMLVAYFVLRVGDGDILQPQAGEGDLRFDGQSVYLCQQPSGARHAIWHPTAKEASG